MASSSPSDSAPRCAECGDTGWKRVPGGVSRCECRLALRGDSLIAAAHIPARYRHCTLENFDLPAGARTLRLAHGQASAYARDFPAALPNRDRTGLLFYGTVGTGKTHLAVGILQQLLERGIACRFCDFRDILKQIQASFDPANPTTERTIVQPLLEVDVLLLDDLGVGRATEWALETLHYILNHRYSQNLATLVTTNLEDGDSPMLAQAVGERLRSRLYEMCAFVALHGRDFRRETAAALVR